MPLSGLPDLQLPGWSSDLAVDLFLFLLLLLPLLQL